jgi:DNA-binding transcriptional LysR family regulator
VKARCVGTLAFAAYAAGASKDAQIKRLPWITYDESMSHLPQARWIARLVGSEAGSLCGLRVHDAETALEAAAVGLGKTLLPTIVADRDPRLRRLPSLGAPAPSREIWLLAHADQMRLARVSATIRWLETVVKGADQGASARGGSGNALRHRVRAGRG